MKQTVLVAKPVEDWGHAQVEFDFEIQPNKDVKVTFRARLLEDKNDSWQATGGLTVPPKRDNAEPGVPGPAIDIMRKPFSPVRAHIEFTVHNNWAP